MHGEKKTVSWPLELLYIHVLGLGSETLIILYTIGYWEVLIERENQNPLYSCLSVSTPTLTMYIEHVKIISQTPSSLLYGGSRHREKERGHADPMTLLTVYM